MHLNSAIERLVISKGPVARIVEERHRRATTAPWSNGVPAVSCSARALRSNPALPTSSLRAQSASSRKAGNRPGPEGRLGELADLATKLPEGLREWSCRVPKHGPVPLGANVKWLRVRSGSPSVPPSTR